MKNVIMKGATAPFKLLAGLAGGGDDLDTIDFGSGSADLEEQEREKLMHLAKALDACPQLSVNVRGQVSYAAGRVFALAPDINPSDDSTQVVLTLDAL